MLVQLALKLEYPPMLLYVGMLVHSLPRVLEVEVCCPRLSPQHRLPHVPAQSYVDNTTQVALGTSKYIMSVAPSAVL
eukprot:5971644-Pyramimonas_sp.AAC.1